MRYFCYISERLVGQLLDQIDASYGKIAAEKQEVASNYDANADTGFDLPVIGNLLKGGLSFGRKSTVHRDIETRKTTVERLIHLIKLMSRDSKIEAYPENSVELSQKAGDFVYFSGSFRPREPVTGHPSNSVIDIVCDDGEVTVVLSCSLKNFSESAPENGVFTPHSGNKIFFVDMIPLKFETVFQIQHFDQEAMVLYCSPIFIAVGNKLQAANRRMIEI